MARPLSYFHLHLISDATGETLLAAGRVVAAQYANAPVIRNLPASLTNRGIKAANVPSYRVLRCQKLSLMLHTLVVGLIATAERNSQILQKRPLGNVPSLDTGLYTDRAAISEELSFAVGIIGLSLTYPEDRLKRRPPQYRLCCAPPKRNY